MKHITAVDMCLALENSEKRKHIDKITEECGYDEWSRWLPEISIIGPPNSVDDCRSYVMKQSGINGSDIELMHFISYIGSLSRFSKINKPGEGCLCIYYEGACDVHAALYQKDGTVISKWGRYGPVVKHPIDFVPTYYGEAVKFYRFSARKLPPLSPKP